MKDWWWLYLALLFLLLLDDAEAGRGGPGTGGPYPWENNPVRTEYCQITHADFAEPSPWDDVMYVVHEVCYEDLQVEYKLYLMSVEEMNVMFN